MYLTFCVRRFPLDCLAVISNYGGGESFTGKRFPLHSNFKSLNFPPSFPASSLSKYVKDKT